MVRMRFESSDDKPLRDKLFEVLMNSRTTASQDMEALLQCVSFMNDRALVEQTAKECGLKLVRFQTNDVLELYFDIKQGRHDLGYISKGWNDPGFRVGDLIEVPKANSVALRNQAYALLTFCANRGVTLTVAEVSGGVEIQMESAIYLEGFNKKVFEQVLYHLNLCVEKAQKLIK
jgi:hypothetical protein